MLHERYLDFFHAKSNLWCLERMIVSIIYLSTRCKSVDLLWLLYGRFCRESRFDYNKLTKFDDEGPIGKELTSGKRSGRWIVCQNGSIGSKSYRGMKLF